MGELAATDALAAQAGTSGDESDETASDALAARGYCAPLPEWRKDGKQALLVEMLRRPGGASAPSRSRRRERGGGLLRAVDRGAVLAVAAGSGNRPHGGLVARALPVAGRPVAD